jgi:hypothetical protein
MTREDGATDSNYTISGRNIFFYTAYWGPGERAMEIPPARPTA